jgi:hypothetical protein
LIIEKQNAPLLRHFATFKDFDTKVSQKGVKSNSKASYEKFSINIMQYANNATAAKPFSQRQHAKQKPRLAVN